MGRFEDSLPLAPFDGMPVPGINGWYIGKVMLGSAPKMMIIVSSYLIIIIANNIKLSTLHRLQTCH